MNESSNYKTASAADEEKQDHDHTIEDFFSCFHLQDIRRMLWDWLVASLSTESGAYSTGFARSNLFFVYEKLESLIEATHEINRRRKKKLKRNRRKWNNLPAVKSN